MTTQPPLAAPHVLTGAPLLALDTETTGVDPATARLLQVAAYAVHPDGTATPLVVGLVDPGTEVEIPAGATAVHGIDRATLGAADYVRPVAAIAQQLHGLLTLCAAGQVPVVAYNAPYDLGVLAAELAREGLALPDPLPPIIDPLVLDRWVDRYRKGSRKLQDTATHYGVQLPEGLGWHDAQADCLAAAELARVLLDVHPELQGLTAAELHAVQVTAHQEWQDGYNAWRQGKGMEPIAGGWPL